ncbi:MAG TPA: tandem-95 repeat protein [Verrucomicrobiae bacterium]|nr:tandem-95 repeat protein [Verrucomicrobiae bacterium]
MTDPSSLRFAGRCSFWLASAATLALTALAGTAARAQSNPPAITAQPQSLTVTQGMSASFSVTVTGTGTLVYQWFRNNTNLLDGATNSTLLLSNVMPADAGAFKVIVTNQFGADTSLAATLTVFGLDFGDAPDPPFPTLLAQNGARHVIVPGVHLGPGADAEPDGQPTPSASGDGVAGSGDDGVFFPGPLRLGQPASIQVVASTNGLLNAWIDFDHANAWTGSGEQVFTNLPLVAGTNALPFIVPSSALAGQAFARFRFSTRANVSFAGLAADGEVEDYAVTLEPTADLAVTASASTAVVFVGDNLTFTMGVTNRGPSEATNVFLVSKLSPEVQFVSVVNTRGACTNGGDTVICLVSNLSAGGRFTVAIGARAGPGTNLCSATITGAQFDSVPTNNSAVAQALGTLSLAPFQNPETIFLDEILGGPGSIYPSTINVSGVTTRVHKVTVTLHSLSHSFPDDLDVLLVGPGGKTVLLMSDCGLNNAISDVTLTFDDDAAGFLPDSDPPIVSGVYRPSNCFSSEDLVPPAPPRPYGAQLGVYNGGNPNGTWSLFVVDDLPEQGGFIAEGWSLNLVTSDPIADLGVTQTANAANVPVGSNLVYTVSVTNQGPANTSATVVDTLPLSANFVSAFTSQGSCSNSGNLVTCLVSNLNSGGGAGITIVVIPTLGGPITNRASVSGGFLDVVASNNTASLVTTVLPVSDVAIVSASGSGSGLLLQPLTYSIQMTNYGPNVAANSTITGTLPAGMNFVSAIASQGGCAYAAGVVTCSLGSVAPGGGAAVTIVGQPGVAGLNTNHIQIAASVLDHFPTNDTAEIVTGIDPAADFGVFAVPPSSSVLFGQNWSQTLQVSNLGPSTAGATLTATLAPQLQFISAVPSQGACSNATNMVLCNLGSLAATQNVSIALVTRPTALGSFTNLVVVAGTFADTDLSNNTVRPRASVVANGDVELSSRGTPDPVWLGENVSFVLSVTNHGPNNATLVSLTNALPPAFSFVLANASQGGCFLVGNTVNCSLGTLAAGAAASVTIVGRAVATGLVTNTARVTAVEVDAVPSNNDAVLLSRIVSSSGRFTNVISVIINDEAIAAPYPSTIQVSGLTAAVFRVRVTLTNLAHTYPDDLDILLVGPEGQTAVLMSDAGGELAPGSITLTFDEDASSPLADSAVLQSGIFRPANYELTPDVWPPPAPAGPYGTNLAVFRGTNPNGVWSLYVVDDSRKDTGIIASGWGLTFSTLEPINDVLVAQTLSANPVGVASNFVVTCRVTNLGPALATNLWLTNAVSPALNIVSVTPSQGTAATQGGEIVCNLGVLASGGSATVVIQSVPLAPATFTNRVTVGAAQCDLRAGNNASEVVVEIETPPSITLHPVGLTVTNGDTVVFTGAATGMEPLRYQWQRNGVSLADATNTTLVLSNVTPNNSGRYRLLAANRVGVASSDEALLRVLGPPAVSDIPDQEILEDTSTGLLELTVEDAESPPELILLRGVSSDTNIVAASGIIFDGTGSNRHVRVTPLPNAFGLVTISVVAVDPDGSVTTQPFLLNILPVNDPPAISGVGNYMVGEDTPAVVNFLIDDVETLPDHMLYWITSSNPALVPTNNVVFSGVGAARVATITPTLNNFGSSVVTLYAQDESGDAVSDSFLLTVVAVNDPPTLNAIDDLVIEEDSGAHELTLTGITSGATNELQQLILSANSGNPALVPAPSITYTSPSNTARITLTPLTNAHGTAQITVTVRDGDTTNQTFSRSFTVTVHPVNDPPVLAPIPPVSSPEDQVHSVAIAVSDPDDDAAAITLIARSSNQSVLPDAGLALGGSGSNRSLLLTPAPDAFGTATVQLIATDPHGAATTNSFIVTITPVNDPPRLDALSGISIPEDAPVQSIPLTGIRAGPTNESGPLTVSAVSSNPALIPDPGVQYTSPATNGTLRLQPATNATGVANITVTVTDSEGAQTARAFSVAVIATNDPPTIANIADQSTPEDTAIDVSITVGDPETPAPLLTLSAVSGNTSLVASAGIVLDGSGSNRTARITPVPNQSGNANITVFVSDGGSTNSRTFQLTVTASNDPPTLNVLTNLNLTTSPGPVSLPLTGITAGPGENQALSVTVTNSNPGFFQNQPGANYNSPNTSGTLTFRVGNNQTGSVVIMVTVTDNGTPAASFSRSFVLNVRSPTNTLPTISIITNQITAEDTPTAAIPFTIRDAETPAANLTLSATSSNLTLLPNANITLVDAGTNRTITLTPAPNQSGDAAVTLTVTDAAFGSSNLTFTLTVNAVNDPPVISSINDRSTPEEVAIEVPFTVSDVETAAGDLGVTAVSSNQGVVPNAGIRVGGSGANRALVITPAPNQTGTATITVQVTDGSATNAATFQLTVDGVNDPPVISAIGGQTTSENTPTGPIPFVVGDIESVPAALTLTGSSSNPALVLDTGIVFGGGDSNRTVTVTPQPNAFGSAVITVTVSDPGGASATASFALTVAFVNDPPTLDPISNLLVNQDSGPQIVALTGLSAGPGESNQTLSVSATTQDTNVVRVLAVDYAGGSTATLTLAPVPSALGAATITVVVNDGQTTNNLASRTFTVTVNAAPVISYVPDQTTLESTPTALIRFSISDAESAADQLTVTVTSASPLAPPGSVTLIGAGADRVLLIAPAAGLSGAALISIAVADPQGASNTFSFHLIVLPDSPPTLLPIPDQMSLEDIPITIPLTITDAETPNGPFALSGTSSSFIVQPGGISFGGSGSNRNVTIIGLADLSGPTVITIRVGDFSGRTSTNSFNLFIMPVQDHLQIVEQPQSVIVPPGGTARFNVRATGGSTLLYQWRKNGVDIPGATNSTLLILNARLSNEGAYTVFIRNEDLASQESEPAQLTVFAVVQILDIRWIGSTATILYAAPAGSTNTLEFKRPITSTDWLPVATQVATGAVMTVVDPVATNTSRFYRIRMD